MVIASLVLFALMGCSQNATSYSKDLSAELPNLPPVKHNDKVTTRRIQDGLPIPGKDITPQAPKK